MQNTSQPMFLRFYTDEMKSRLAGKATPSGFTIDDVLRSGVENPDSSIGGYAGDEASYDVFSPLFDKVIETYHGFGPDATHKRLLDAGAIRDLENLDPTGEAIISTRIRVGRNLAGFPFAPKITKEERKEVERRIVEALGTLRGDLAGAYYPLEGMEEDVRAKLVSDHFLFKQGDRFLKSAGANRDWPSGRGIFHSADKRFLVWVNEEDQLRIISMQEGADILAVFERLARAITTLEQKLAFACSDRLGYLTSCPTNLGTAMRASVHVKLPTISKDPRFKAICDQMKISVRGIHGEHSESEGGIYDISNKQRLGVSEVEVARAMHHGLKKLLEWERVGKIPENPDSE